MNMNIVEMTATQLSAAIRAGETTATEATEAVLAQIEKEDKKYNCYVTVDRDGALAQAAVVQKKIEDGELSGPCGRAGCSEGQYLHGGTAHYLFLENSA